MTDGRQTVEHARRFLGLINDQGYALCLRCKARLENEDKLYCRSCDEMIYAEWQAGFRVKP